MHTETFVQKIFRCRHLKKFLHRSFFTEAFYTETLLYTEAFTQNLLRRRSFYTQKLLDRSFLDADIFTHRSFFGKKFLHTESFFPQNLLRTLRRRFCTQNLLRTDFFRYRCFYVLYVRAFLQKSSCV